MVTVDIDEATTQPAAVDTLVGAVKAITPTAGDDVQTEAAASARCALLATLKASKELKLGPFAKQCGVLSP